MAEAWDNVKPKDYFKISSSFELSNENMKVLTLLYQPIIGNDAFALFHTFYSYSSIKDRYESMHSKLLLTQNISLPNFYDARLKLEAIGLLEVFLEVNNNEKIFYYDLKQPLTCNDFYNDDVLSVIFLNHVGEIEFKQVFEELNQTISTNKNGENITKKFLDIFQFNPTNLKDSVDILDQNKTMENNEKKLLINVSKSNFDWKLLRQLLNTNIVDSLNDQDRQTIITYHELYGMDELTIKYFIELSIDPVSNVFDNLFFKKIVNKNYLSPFSSSAIKVQNDNLKENSAATFSKGEISVINSSKNLSPVDFLVSIKEQKGGFVTNSELQMVERLVQLAVLPKSVINILIHFILVIQDNKNLNKNYLEIIANDWSQSNIKTPEQAVLKVKNYEIAPKTKKASKRNKTLKKEKLPDWVNNEPNNVNPISEERALYLKKMLSKIEKDEEKE